MGWKPFLRQLFLCTGPWTLYFLHGLSMGFPTVLVPQLRKANQTVTIEETSWLIALHTYCGIPWVVLISLLIVIIGRKKAHIIVCVSSLVGFIIFFFCNNIVHFMIGEIFLSSLASSYMTTSIIILTEYVSAKNRGIFLTIKSATLFWGILAANAIGSFYHWKAIVLLALICNIYNFINVYIWPESPLWLASKGRFEECSAAHRWLKGNDADSERELQKLLKLNENRRIEAKQWGIHMLKTLCRKQFFKPISLCILLICIYCFSGKLICTVFAIDILKKISNNETTAYYGMLIIDGVTVASMYLGCFLSKFLRRRLILLTFSIIGITTMIVISIYLYLAKLSVIEENKYLSISLLVLYSVTTSCGPMLMTTTIIGELLPLKSRILSLCIIALSFKIIYGTFAKMAPFIFKRVGIHGTFALFAILSGIMLTIIYYFVPETKDKTIHEIDDCLTKKDRREIEESNVLLNPISRP